MFNNVGFEHTAVRRNEQLRSSRDVDTDGGNFQRGHGGSLQNQRDVVWGIVHDPSLYAVVLFVHDVKPRNPVWNYRVARQNGVTGTGRPSGRGLVKEESGGGSFWGSRLSMTPRLETSIFHSANMLTNFVDVK